MEQIYNYLKHLHIDPIIFLIVFASGFFVNRFLKQPFLSKDLRTDAAWKTLFVSFVVAVIYLYMNSTPREMFAELFLSYFMATSLYELMIRPFAKFIQKQIKKYTGDEE